VPRSARLIFPDVKNQSVLQSKPRDVPTDMSSVSKKHLPPRNPSRAVLQGAHVPGGSADNTPPPKLAAGSCRRMTKSHVIFILIPMGIYYKYPEALCKATLYAAAPGRRRGAGSSVLGCFRGPGGAGGGGLGGKWVVCGRAGRYRVKRLPAVVFSRSGLWFFPQLKVLACLSVWFGCMIPGLYGVIQYTLSLLPVRHLPAG
jgi:hypothetical protein